VTSTIIIPGESGQVSDGYHTFDELYTHRHILFLNLVRLHNDWAFKTRKNNTGEEWKGWFILGLNTPYGQISYHLPNYLWDLARVEEIEQNNDYDGHSSSDVVDRLISLL